MLLFKIQKEKRAGLQFTSTDYLSLLLTPLRIRWTIPLIGVYKKVESSVILKHKLKRFTLKVMSKSNDKQY
jgi:hypothetical protein